ncbi:MAG: hypothetical protein LUD57_00815 [Ruminococcus sp.]|nr:hypothetical protein [Ruminococcus sp.]
MSDFVKNQVKLATLEPDEYCAWVYEENAANGAESVKESYEEYLDKMKNGSSGSVALKYKTTDEAKDMLLSELIGSDYADSSDEDIQTIVDIINNVDSLEIGVESNAKNSETSGSVYASLNGDNLVTAEIAVDVEDFTYFMRVPELTETWLGMDMSSALDDMSSEQNAIFDILMDVASNPDELSDLINDYAAVWSESIEDVELEKKESIDIGSIETEYTAITAEIDGKKAVEIAQAFIEKAADDKTIKKLVSDKIGICTEDEYEEVLDELADELKEVKQSGDFGDEAVELVTYVDATGTIRGFEISFEDEFECLFAVDKEKDNIAAELSLTVEGEDIVSIVLDAEEEDKDVYSGEIECSISNGYDTYGASIEFDGFEIVDEEKSYVNCNLAIVVEDIDPISLKLESDGSSQDISYDVNLDGTDFGTVTLSMFTYDSAKVSVPDAADAYMIDIYDLDLEDYVTEDEISSFVTEILEKIGLSSDLAEEIVDELFYGYDDYYYDDYYDYYYDDYYDYYDDDYDYYDYYDAYDDYDTDNTIIFEEAVSAESGDAYLAIVNGQWWVQYWGNNDDEGSMLAYDAGVVAITGDGDYTVSVTADTNGFRYDVTGDANGDYIPLGCSFAALMVNDGTTLYPDMTIEITSIRVDGTAIPLIAKNYTTSDDGVEMRTNIYNEWVSDENTPEDAHDANGVITDTTGYSAQIIDPSAFDDGWTTVEVDFTVTGTGD